MKKYMIAILLAAIGFPAAALSQPVDIKSPEALDSKVLDFKGPVLLVLCRDEQQCGDARQALDSAESSSQLAQVKAAAAAKGLPELRFAVAKTGDLPELAAGWDKDDMDVCIRDVSKSEAQCNNLAYPVFILKHGDQKSSNGSLAAGVEEMKRGAADSNEVVGMALRAYSVLGVEPSN
jgi:hypothetical protein